MELLPPSDTPPRPEALCSDKVMLSLSSSLLQPHPPVWITLSDFPFGYTESLGHSRAILTTTQTFPTLTARHCMRAVAKANMWWKRRDFKDEDVKSVVRKAMTITDREENGAGTYWVLRRRADGNHVMSGSQSREGLGCSQDSP